MAIGKSKAKKSKAPKTSSKEQLSQLLSRMTAVLAAHGVLIMFLLAGVTIGFALVRARGYLNPTRDEAAYTNATSHNNYSKIDYKLVNKLEASLNRAPINVGQSLSPNRSNPFSE